MKMIRNRMSSLVLFSLRFDIDLRVKNWQFGPEKLGLHVQVGDPRQSSMQVPPFMHKL